MTYMQQSTSEAFVLATKVADRYGKLALSHAAGEAASAERLGDLAGRDMWSSVVAYLREAIIQKTAVTA